MERKMNEEEWQAIVDGNKKYDGKFYYALKTTKSICKPSCTARTPNPKNVVIFPTMEEALKSGYHACRRCRPDQPNWPGAVAEMAIKAAEYMDVHYNEKISLTELSDIFFIDPFHLHRCFKRHYGKTLMDYQHEVRTRHAKTLLRHSEHSLSYIAEEIGYSSLSHFSRAFKKIEGETPSHYKNHPGPNHKTD